MTNQEDNKKNRKIEKEPQKKIQTPEEKNKKQPKTTKMDPTKYGDWQVKGRTIDF